MAMTNASAEKTNDSAQSRLAGWDHAALDKRVQREPTVDKGRIILWVPGESDRRWRKWERISNVPGDTIELAPTIGAMTATLVPARERIGFWGVLARLFRQSTAATTWFL